MIPSELKTGNPGSWITKLWQDFTGVTNTEATNQTNLALNQQTLEYNDPVAQMQRFREAGLSSWQAAALLGNTSATAPVIQPTAGMSGQKAVQLGLDSIQLIKFALGEKRARQALKIQAETAASKIASDKIQQEILQQELLGKKWYYSNSILSYTRPFAYDSNGNIIPGVSVSAVTPYQKKMLGEIDSQSSGTLLRTQKAEQQFREAKAQIDTNYFERHYSNQLEHEVARLGLTNQQIATAKATAARAYAEIKYLPMKYDIMQSEAERKKADSEQQRIINGLKVKLSEAGIGTKVAALILDFVMKFID